MKTSMGAPSSSLKMCAHRSVVAVGEEAKDKKPFKLVAVGSPTMGQNDVAEDKNTPSVQTGGALA
jgi:hypothetical protein